MTVHLPEDSDGAAIKSDMRVLHDELLTRCHDFVANRPRKLILKCFGLSEKAVDTVKRFSLEDLLPLLHTPVLLFRPTVDFVSLAEVLAQEDPIHLPDGLISSFDQADLPQEYIRLHSLYFLTIRSISREMDRVTASFFSGLTPKEIDVVRLAPSPLILKAIQSYVTFFQPRVDFSFISKTANRNLSPTRIINEAVAAILAAETSVEQLKKYR
ncbi:MAG: hypothetical protein F8N36_13835 [Desulfovibrio sp.]|uniref:hypothetical protein n=1 Tax=Desulfovibrio sp. TaxID=885 RepID=UPI00135D2C36|nr:hypothetical protein [Desulfovibrio sp.]MTJ93919.1 hypothetical protein [Desulfovibrio sp.]